MSGMDRRGKPALRRRWSAAAAAVAPGALLVLGAVFALLGCRPLPTLTPTALPTPLETPRPAAPPTIELANRDVRRGDEVLVIGENWPGEAEVIIQILPLFEDEGGEDAQAVASVVAAADGSFEARFTFPSDPGWAGAPGAFVRAWVAESGQDATAVLRLRQADETAEPSPTPTEAAPEPTATPTPSVTPTPTVTPMPTPTVGCSDRASFVADVTIPDNTTIQPGQTFIKTWRLRNSGSCTWTTGYALVYVSGHRLGSSAAVPLGAPVAPGRTVDLSVTLTAPAENGVFQGKWMLRSAAGRQFGTGANANGLFWVRIRVGPTPVPTPVISAWRGDYYANPDLSGAPKLTRDDAAISFDWARGAPAAGLPSDGFSARWTRTPWFDQGLYRFHALVDDGVRLYLDSVLVIDSWRDGTRRELTGDIAIAAGNHNARVEYYERTGDAQIQIWWEKVTSYPDWRGEYWSNRSLSGNPVLVRNDAHIDFNWKVAAPAPGLPADGFSARWTREVSFEAATYRFLVGVDDGARLWIDDKLIIDTWRDSSYHEISADYALVAGKHQVRLEYYENVGDAHVRLTWEKAVSPSYPDWKGEYWSNRSLSGNPALARNDAHIDFNWKAAAPAPGLPADGFSARWTREVRFEAATYRFLVGVDDGARLWIDGQLIIDTWRDGSYREASADHALLAGRHQVRLEYYENVGDARVRLTWEKVASPSYPDWKGEYWSNRKLSGNPALVRNDSAIDFAWGTDSAAPGLPADNFSARWTRQLKFDAGVYRIQARADDGIRVYLDSELVIDEWHDSPGDTTYKVDVPITAGKHTPRVEYYDRTGQALVKVWWKRVGDLPTPTPVPNNPPVAVDDLATTDQDTAVAIDVLANDTDLDGDDLSVTAFSATSVQGGGVACTGAGWCTYTPLPDFVGDDSFTYVVGDGKGGSDGGLVVIDVKPSAGNDGDEVVINEVLPVPALGVVDGEWVELHNSGDVVVDLGGWALDDGDGGSVRYLIPAGTVIGPDAFLVFRGATTGIDLADSGDQVQLLQPDGALVDSVTFGQFRAGASYSRDPSGFWHADWPPSAGEPNLPDGGTLQASVRIPLGWALFWELLTES